MSAVLEWGPIGALALDGKTDVLVVVDVLSFSTAVEIAVSRGARVFPYEVRDRTAARRFADARGARLAVERQRASATEPYSLSPKSLATLPAGSKLVLPSLNGSSITVQAAGLRTRVFAGCLRNASAVARAAQQAGARVGVVAAGERWPDGSLRPAVEDLLGAGAIVRGLERPWSAEAEVAAAAFDGCAGELRRVLENSVSGRELAAMGFVADVQIAAELDVSQTVPVFRDGAYERLNGPM